MANEVIDTAPVATTTTPTKTETKAVAKTPKEKYIALMKSEKLAQQMQASIADADPEFVRQCTACVLNAASKNPTLYSCSQLSVTKAVLDSCMLKVLPDGIDAYLVPYGAECQFQLSYRGMIALATKSERIVTIEPEIFCRGDRFVWKNGQIDHEIDWMEEDRGEMRGAYATAIFKDGTRTSEVLSKSEIEEIRKMSRNGNAGPWKTRYNEMAKKTAVRRLAKRLPLTPAARAAFEYDDKQNFDFVDAEPVAKPKQSADALADAFEALEAEPSND